MGNHRKPSAVIRAWNIARVGLRYFVFHKLTRHRSATLGVRIRLSCEELGLVFIKLGQILSTRYDLLTADDCKALQPLLDNAPAFAAEDLDAIFKTDFGKSPQDLYSSFERQPIASASIAQVYVALGSDGTKLAVKVRRPDAEKYIHADLRVLRRLAKMIQWFRLDLRSIHVDRVIAEMEAWLLAEVDFENEARNIESYRQFYGGPRMKDIAYEYTSRLLLPHIHPNLCSKNVITMDFIEGVPLKDIDRIRENPEYNIRASLLAMIGAVMRAWMAGEGMYFQADPHPSNVLVLPHGRLALVDFGLVGHLGARDAERARDVFLSVYSRDVEQTVLKALDFANASYETYSEKIRSDIQAYINNTQYSGLGQWFMDFIRIFVRHGLQLPYEFILFGRMEIIMDGSVELALPGETTLSFLGKELRWGMRQRALNNLRSIDLAPILYLLTEKAKRNPEKAARLIDKYFEDPLRLIRDFKEALRA